MLTEWLSSLTCSCPPYVRQMGYLYEAIAIQARYKRCHTSWQPHLQSTRHYIEATAERCRHHRTAVILGAGNSYDIPLETLTHQFEDVWLVDIVFLHKARRLAQQYGAHTITHDITGVAETLWRGEMPDSSPHAFLNEDKIDLVMSVNLLSQLPYLPCRHLKKKGHYSPEEIEHYRYHLMEAHLAYLQKFKEKGTMAGAVTDRQWLVCDQQEVILSQEDALAGLTLPRTENHWIWEIAPAPEIHREYDRKHEVVAFSL